MYDDHISISSLVGSNNSIKVSCIELLNLCVQC